MRKGKLTKDHLVPRSRGGTTTPENIVPACEECNQKKANLPIWSMINAHSTVGN